ncbi:MAG: DUF177 domain-containing protein [Caldilineales bacterium]|nr:DUF177 domain-containing protein [Caldilineales bacterium]MDW8318114.1 DUF177 domain-containing protein [Anaerolineae bacterium]
MDKPRDALFNVAQLLKEPIGATRAYDILAPIQHLLPELIAAEPLIGHVQLMRTDRGILVQGELAGHVVVPCSRCLADVRVPVILHIEEQFQPTVDVVRGVFLEVDEEDEALLIDEHHILDLHEVLRQEVLLEIPMQPLCRPDCAGLCPSCGEDLNLGACQCATAEVDPRWADLGALLADVDV